MSAVLIGNVYEHKRTKDLLHYIPKQAVVLIWHEDLDGMAVEGLLKKRVKAIINGKASMSGKYKHENVTKLLNSGIPVFDITVPHQRWERLNGEEVMITAEEMFVKKEDHFMHLASVKQYNLSVIGALLDKAAKAYPHQLMSFVENTLEYAKKECTYFIKEPLLPRALQRLENQDVLIVARSPSYEADIKAVRAMVKRNHVRIIAIDGAADGLLNNNLTPDFIIGDMDSISEKGLLCGATLLCHENIHGSSPGKERLNKMGISAETITFVGTSEDVAIHAAFWSRASHLYLIGCRISLHEFLEKGRAGMGASLLNRIQAGEKITDLKGIHRLSESSWSLVRLKKQIKLYMEKLSLIRDSLNGWRKKEAIRHE